MIISKGLFDYLKKGDEVKINGPYGHFHIRKTERPMIFIAGGSGIAPIKCMLHQMKNEGIARRSIFFFGVRTMADLFLDDTMDRFAAGMPHFKFVPVVSQPAPEAGWKGKTGRVTEIARAYLTEQSDAAEYEGYLCGSPGMIESSISVLTEFKIPEDRIYYDKFS